MKKPNNLLSRRGAIGKMLATASGLMVLLSINIHAATRYVNTGADAGGNGTTPALTGANCAYQTLFAWEADRDGVLSEPEIVYCAGTTADTTAVIIAGWTTSAANYIRIVGENSGGKWSTSKYRISTENAIGLYIQEDYVRIEDMQIEVNGANNNLFHACTAAFITATDNYIKITGCMFRTDDDATYYASALNLNDADINADIWNCMFHNRSANAGINNLGLVLQGPAVYVLNCTEYGGTYGVRCVGGVVYCTNTIASATGTADFSRSSGTFTVGYCASEDLTADDWSGDGNDTGNTFSFTDAANTDFRLLSTDVGAKDLGLDLSATFTTDIKGSTRTAPWDMGADEYIAPAAAVTVKRPTQLLRIGGRLRPL